MLGLLAGAEDETEEGGWDVVEREGLEEKNDRRDFGFVSVKFGTGMDMGWMGGWEVYAFSF